MMRRSMTSRSETVAGAGRLLDAAQPRVQSAGDRTALVTEELGFEKRFGQGRAIQCHERAARAPRAAVNEAGNDLLVGPRLAGQQHRRKCRRDTGSLFENLPPLLRSELRRA